MNISCEVIKDLLPLYHDGICSNDSKALVEQHLAQCSDCTAELNAMDALLPVNTPKENLHEAEAIKNLSRKWKKGRWISLLKGIGIATVAFVLLFLFLYLFMDFKIITTP